MKGFFTMELRPIDNELLETCLSIDFCRDCPKRIGCRLRYEFYNDDSYFEICLQLAEIYVMKTHNLSSDSTLEASNNIRRKRKCEIMTNPSFSYV